MGPGQHQGLPGTPGPGKGEPRLATASSPGQRGRAELLLWAPGRRGGGRSPHVQTPGACRPAGDVGHMTVSGRAARQGHLEEEGRQDGNAGRNFRGTL